MTKDQQFTVSMQHFQSMNPAELELFCTRLLPGMLFRFATFVNHDYRQGALTCYLYSHVPGSVFFTVESPMEIESALEKLQSLNPGVEWHWATVRYIDQDETGHARVTIELTLSKIPLRVSAAGKLICK